MPENQMLVKQVQDLKAKVKSLSAYVSDLEEILLESDIAEQSAYKENVTAVFVTTAEALSWIKRMQLSYNAKIGFRKNLFWIEADRPWKRVVGFGTTAISAVVDCVNKALLEERAAAER